MIKIRALGARELKQVLNLLERFSEKEFEYSALQKFRQLYIPIQRISQMLPAHFQFLPAVYVAVSRQKVLGLIWLSQDGKKKNRWKIDQLIIDPDEFSYDIGTQLVHFVINRYGADGVQTFLALVDNRCDQALGLLRSCGFRQCTRLHSFIHDSPATLDLLKENINGLREAGRSDRNKLQALHSDCLPPEVRLSLEKVPADFTHTPVQYVMDKLQGIFFKRWVVEDTARDVLLASLEIVTVNFRDFHLQLWVSPAWKTGYEVFLHFAIRQVLKNTSTAKIYIQSYEFDKEETALLEKTGFSRTAVIEVLVKDYWIPLEDKFLKPSSPILLFTGKTSPACLNE